jgi:uncharacterized protein
MAKETNASSEQRTRGFFRDKSVLITGASSGIGEDAALGFARQGASVALFARRKEKLEDLAGRINLAGGRALPIAGDVTRRADVNAAVEQVTRTFNRLDILVNSAGVLIPDEVENIKLHELEQMMKVNLYGALHTIQAAIPIMREQGGGSIVNVASLAGRRGMSPLGGYAATKFAMVGLTEALRMEMFGTGVRVSLVMPGVIDTPMTNDADLARADYGSVPGFARMPVAWVTWAVLAAAAFGLAEVSVPLGAGIGEKLASLFPGTSAAFLSVGSKMMKAANRFISKPPKSAADESQAEVKKAQAARRRRKAGKPRSPRPE